MLICKCPFCGELAGMWRAYVEEGEPGDAERTTRVDVCPKCKTLLTDLFAEFPIAIRFESRFLEPDELQKLRAVGLFQSAE